jgi:hypothetical protein
VDNGVSPIAIGATSAGCGSPGKKPFRSNTRFEPIARGATGFRRFPAVVYT